MPFLAVSNLGLSPASVTSTLDGAVAFLIVAFALGKFYLLFSFLFGYSFTLMLRSKSGSGPSHYRRRLVGLAVLGMLHAVLLFIGDILLSYAAIGAALLWFVGRRTRTALRGAFAAFITGLTLFLLLLVLAANTPFEHAGFIADPAPLDQAIRAGFMPAVLARLDALPAALVSLAVVNWAFALSMFLLGLVAGRLGVLARPERFPKLWTHLLRVGLLFGLPCALVSGWLALFGPSPFWNFAGVILGFATAPALTGAYVALAVRASHTRLLRAAVPAGRMSLTGYLGESVLLGALFAGWGAGLFGQLSLAVTTLVTIGVWLALDGFAAWWLRRFSFGPVEWLLRCWTNHRIEPLRKSLRRSTATPEPGVSSRS